MDVTTTASTGTESTGTINEVSNTQEGGTQPQAGQGVSAATKEKIKLLIDGQEIEEEIDWADKEALKRDRQIARAAEKRMNEAKADKKKAFDIIQAFERDPETMLARLGDKGKEIAEKYLLKSIQDQMMTPEQREARDKKAKEDQEISDLRKFKSDHEAKEAAARQDTIIQEYQTSIINALKITNMPATPDAVKRMAALKLKNLENGLELTPQQLATEYKNEELRKLKAIVGSSDATQLLELFGDEIANKIRKHDLKNLMEKQNSVFQKPHVTSRDAAQPRSDSRDYETTDEWKERISRNLQK